MALFAETQQNVSALSQNVYFSFHVNNSMLECLLGSINFSQRLTFPQPTVPSRFIVKQDLDLPSLYLRQEPSVENSWYVSRMMVFSVSIMVRQSKSQDDREIGKLFAPLWNVLSKIYKNSSLKVVLKILSLCPLSMFEHMSPTFTIAETGLENVCSNLHHRDTTKCSLPLLLVCVSLIFLMMSCDKSYVKQALWLRIARPMCDGRPVASSPFRRLASRGPFFFCGVTLWCFFAVYLCELRSGKVFMPRAVVHSTLRLAFSILPYGLVNVDFSSRT